MLKLLQIFAKIAGKTVKSVPVESFAVDFKEAPMFNQDPKEQEKLDSLHPKVRALVVKVLEKARAQGHAIYIFEAMRDYKRQEQLYAQGRDKNGNIVDKAKVVTYAKPGSSFHNYGLAVDFVFDGDQAKDKVQWSWANNHPWKAIGEIGESVGLEWAGRWTKFPEMPHQQIKGVTTAQLRLWYQEGGLAKVWSEIDKLND